MESRHLGTRMRTVSQEDSNYGVTRKRTGRSKGVTWN